MQWTNNPQLLWTKNDDDSASQVLQNCGIAEFLVVVLAESRPRPSENVSETRTRPLNRFLSDKTTKNINPYRRGVQVSFQCLLASLSFLVFGNLNIVTQAQQRFFFLNWIECSPFPQGLGEVKLEPKQFLISFERVWQNVVELLASHANVGASDQQEASSWEAPGRCFSWKVSPVTWSLLRRFPSPPPTPLSNVTSPD